MTAGPEGRIYTGGFKYDGISNDFAGVKRSEDGGLFESFNAGDSWVSILDQSIHAIAMHPQTSGVFVILRDADILLSANGGSSWIDISGNLSGGSSYDDLCISAADNRIYFASYHHVYSASLDLAAVDSAPAPAIALSAYPNPFNPTSMIKVTLACRRLPQWRISGAPRGVGTRIQPQTHPGEVICPQGLDFY